MTIFNKLKYFRSRNILFNLISTKNYSIERVDLNRVYRQQQSGIEAIMTSNYCAAKHGINDDKQLLVYIPETFTPSLSPYYEQTKYRGIELLKRFNVAKQHSKHFNKIVNIRTDLMSALTSSQSSQQLGCYHEWLIHGYLYDDLTDQLIEPNFTKFNQILCERFKTAHRHENLVLFDKTDSRYSSDVKRYFDEANTVLTILHDISGRLLPILGEIVFENLYLGADVHFEYTLKENALKRENRIISMEEYLNCLPYTVGTQSTKAFIANQNTVLPSFDPWVTIIAVFNRMMNDVLSFDKEIRSIEGSDLNIVSIIQRMYSHFDQLQAMAEICRIVNKLIYDYEMNVKYLMNDERNKYTELITYNLGFIEAQFISQRYQWEIKSGNCPHYATINMREYVQRMAGFGGV